MTDEDYIKMETPDGVRGALFYQALMYFPKVENAVFDMPPVSRHARDAPEGDPENPPEAPPEMIIPIPAVDEATLLKATLIAEIYVSELVDNPEISDICTDLETIQKIAAFYRKVYGHILHEVLVNFMKAHGYSDEEVATLYSDSIMTAKTDDLLR